MKTIIALLYCFSAFAGDTNEIRVVTRTNTTASPGYLLTYEEFTRSGQTNLLRITSTKDGVTNSVAHNFFHQGAFLGCYSRTPGHAMISTAVDAPYRLGLLFDASNQVISASVTTTNYVTLDLFTYTNGIFCPVARSAIEDSNRRTKDIFHR